MPNFSESLTIRILADSSPFQRELESLTRQWDDFESRLGSFSSLGNEIDRTAGRLGSLQSPLSGVSRMLSQITGQIQGISRIPVILNIGPAVAALGGLSQMIEQVGLRMQLLSQLGGSPGAVLSTPGYPAPRYAQGGFVSGPAGRDRVPAWLTAGEFVLRKAAVDQLGVPLLAELNRTGARNLPLKNASTDASSQTVNHFGGINIHVREAGNVNAVVRDLRLQGIRLRNRRG